jgi:hypothetical protein
MESNEWPIIQKLIDKNINQLSYIKYNIIKCIIKLNNNTILQESINHLHTTSVPTEILVPLYKKMYKNNDVRAIDHLIMYYDYRCAHNKKLKYLNIGWYKFKDQRSLCSLIHHYSVNKNYEKVDKYSNILETINPCIAQFMIGMENKLRNKYYNMIKHLKKFFDYLKKEDLSLENKDDLNDNTKAYLNIIRLFTTNEIELHFIQQMTSKFDLITSTIHNNLQFKINKTKLINYRKTGQCNICLDENISLKLFDCLGHYYCDSCTVQLDKCPTCLCNRIFI